jgi:hypothetical protein
MGFIYFKGEKQVLGHAWLILVKKGAFPSTTLRHSTGILNVLPLIAASGSASLRVEITPEKMRRYTSMRRLPFGNDKLRGF